MKNISKNVVLWIIIGLLLIALFNLFQNSSSNNSSKLISFSDFISATDSGNVLEVNIRGNYVSSRPVGAETTVPSNPGLENTSEIPEHFLLHSNFMLKHNKIPNVYLSFKINNILNTIYYHPGARNANSIFDLQDDTSGNYSNWYSNTISNKNCPYIIQEPQNYMLKLIFDM